MTVQEAEILTHLLQKKYTSQRDLSVSCGYSLGIVNRSLCSMVSQGLLYPDSFSPTPAAHALASEFSPKNAIILAAGPGMRMAPANRIVSKGLVQVHGQVLIERLIEFLHQAGIRQIYVVVGFMKEHYEYLIDRYHVQLIINTEYAEKNNLHSLSLASAVLGNTYIIPSDIWLEQNPFRNTELYSWYMVTDKISQSSPVRINNRHDLVLATEQKPGNDDVGICYLCGWAQDAVQKNLQFFSSITRYYGSYWEESLYDQRKMIVPARMITAKEYIHIESYRQICEIERKELHLEERSIQTVLPLLKAQAKDIQDITLLKDGQTNYTFSFRCFDNRYVLTVPQRPSCLPVDYGKVAQLNKELQESKMFLHHIYMSPKTGCRLSKYLEGCRICSANNAQDLDLCVKKLKQVHSLNLKVSKSFHLFDQIHKFHSLWKEPLSCYPDYENVHSDIMSLKPYLESHNSPEVLCHIDVNADNFLQKSDGTVCLIDWENAAMHDPIIDLGMMVVNFQCSKNQVDTIVRTYFGPECTNDTYRKVYAYVAACGFLWSNWCESRIQEGVEFGPYAIHQYRYAKKYFHYFKGCN